MRRFDSDPRLQIILSLRSKPLERFSFGDILLLLMRAARRPPGPRREASLPLLSLRSKPRETFSSGHLSSAPTTGGSAALGPRREASLPILSLRSKPLERFSFGSILLFLRPGASFGITTICITNVHLRTRQGDVRMVSSV